MLGSKRRIDALELVFYAVTLVGFTALWYSPAVVSLASVTCVLLSVYQWKSFKRSSFRHVGISLSGIVVLVLLDMIFSGFESQTSAKFLLIVGFVGVFGASYYYYGKLDCTLILKYLLVIAGILALVNSISIFNYFLNKDHFDALLLQSKHIPVGIHHIHFGVLNGMIVILLLGSFFVANTFNKSLKVITILFLLIIFISFHILSSRTGLLAFYGASVTMLVVYAMQKRQFKVVLLGLLTMGISLAASYSLSSSFQNKVANSLEDMSSWGKGEEINFKSMGMRIEAARMCVYIIGQNPLGVGAAYQDSVMAATYDKLNSVLLEENRVGPHNQFLEYGVRYGWVGIILLIYFFFGLFLWAGHSSFSMWGIVVFIFIAVLFESLLERQVSLYFMALLIPLSYHFFANWQVNEVGEDIN
jgi:O-antigen ligase|tara:strand:+ start:6100 stop:7347 length:1248 start_codon:yes stop_codon:yes gene_type:complete